MVTITRNGPFNSRGWFSTIFVACQGPSLLIKTQSWILPTFRCRFRNMEEFLDPRTTVFMAKNHPPAPVTVRSGKLIPTTDLHAISSMGRFPPDFLTHQREKIVVLTGEFHLLLKGLQEQWQPTDVVVPSKIQQIFCYPKDRKDLPMEGALNLYFSAGVFRSSKWRQAFEGPMILRVDRFVAEVTYGHPTNPKRSMGLEYLPKI